MEENNEKHTSEDIAGRMKLMASIFQKDAQILNLNKEKLDLLQKLYDQEMKMYGGISKIGKEILEVEHCEVFHGRVRELPESEWKENLDFETTKPQTDQGGTVRGKLERYKAVEKQQEDSGSQGRQRDTGVSVDYVMRRRISK